MLVIALLSAAPLLLLFANGDLSVFVSCCWLREQSACAIGGVNCLRLIHEHTATALAYGIYKSAKGEFHEKVPICRRFFGFAS